MLGVYRYILDGNAVISGMERSWNQGYQPIESSGNVTICMPVTAESSNGKVKATLIMDDESASPFKKQTMSATVWRENGLFSIKLRLKLLSDYENGDYRCRMLLEGLDKAGNAISSEYPLTLHLRAGKKASAKIQPSVEGVDAELILGKESVIRANLVNPNLCADMQNIILIVTDSKGTVLPQNSNILPLGSLAAGESMAVEIPVAVLNNAEVTLHQFKFEFAYTALGEEVTYAETFSLLVKQEIRLEHGGIEMDDVIIQGGLASINLPLMNMGRSEIRNALVKLNIPGIADDRSVLVGTIAPGESKNAKLTFIPGKDAVGSLSGTLLISCEDEWRNTEDFELPFSVTVEAAEIKAEESGAPLQTNNAKHDNRLVYALCGLCGSLLIAFILQGAVLKRKIHKLEEDRL